MGTDYHTYLIVGADIKPSDICVSQATGKGVCSEGHEQEKPTWKKCPICGGDFTQVLTRVYTGQFQAYAKTQGVEPEELFEAWTGASLYDSDIGFHCVDEHQSSERDPKRKMLGLKLVRSSISMAELQEAHDTIKNIRDALGLSCTINIYQVLYASV